MNLFDFTTKEQITNQEPIENNIIEKEEDDMLFTKEKKADNAGSKKNNKLNFIDKATVFTIYGLVRGADFIATDLVGGRLHRKVKEKVADNKARRLLKKQGWCDVNNGPEVETATVPAVINVTDEDLKIPFTVEQPAEKMAVNNAMLNDIITKYNYSNKILAATILYCADKIDEVQVGAVLTNLENADINENIEFVNSITMFYTGKRFAENPRFKDIEFNVNPESLETVTRDLAGLDIMKGNDIFSTIIEKSKEYIKTHSDKIPVIFDNAKLDLFTSNCSKELIAKIEKEYGDIISKYPHVLNKLPGGMIELSIKKSEDSIDKYTIDPGLIFGGEYKMMVTNGTSEILTSNKTIIEKYIDNSSYKITEAEYNQIMTEEHQFFNQSLMLNYDIANSWSKIKELAADPLLEFQARLNYIRAEIIDRYLISPRMRIKNFKDEANFIIVSDNKCNSPLEEMAKETLTGLTVKVKDDKFTIEFSDENGNKISSETISTDINLCMNFMIGTIGLSDVRRASAIMTTTDAIMGKTK